MKKEFIIQWPLIWPENKPRAEKHLIAPYRSNNMAGDILRINYIVQNSKFIEKAILTSNLKISAGGNIYGRHTYDRETAASLILTVKGHRYILACDKFERTRHNIHAITKALEHYENIWKSGIRMENIEIVNA